MKHLIIKNFKFIIIAYALILAGCNSPTEVKYSGQYFPLNVGNKWYYAAGDSSTVNEIWVVAGTKTFSGIQYYQVDIQDAALNKTGSYYYRYNGDTLFCKLPDYAEYIVADFSLRLNDTAYWNKEITVTEKTQDLITFSVPLTGDYSYSATYVKGVGLTEMAENGFVFYHRKLVKSEIK